MYTYVATGLIAATVAATGAWKVQDWRYGAEKAEHAEQQLENERLAAKGALRNADRVIEAQNKAEVRARGLRLDAAGARSAAISLHDAAAAAMRDAAVSHAACTERASALRDVLQASAERYRDLGETCDRHVSDIKTLIESWPKEY